MAQLNKFSKEDVMTQISEMKSISKQDVKVYHDMTTYFFEDLSDNIFLSTLRIHEKYSKFSLQMWSIFLNFPVIISLKDTLVSEEIATAANKGLIDPMMKAKANLIDIKETMEKKSKPNNSNYIILRLPDFE